MSDAMPAQSAESHARMVPGFHYFGGLLVIAYLIASLWMLLSNMTVDNGMRVVGAVILVNLFWYVRAFPVSVQDRLIRLEERLRMMRVLPADMHGHIEKFTPRQLIAMRFASDAELAELARRVLAENIEDSKAIKGAIKAWRADHMRV